jgi:hypothetical protein
MRDSLVFYPHPKSESSLKLTNNQQPNNNDKDAQQRNDENGLLGKWCLALPYFSVSFPPWQKLYQEKKLLEETQIKQQEAGTNTTTVLAMPPYNIMKQTPTTSVVTSTHIDEWWDTKDAVPDLVDDDIATGSTAEEDHETILLMPIYEHANEDFNLLLANATSLSRAISDDQVTCEHGSVGICAEKATSGTAIVTPAKEKEVLRNDGVLFKFPGEDLWILLSLSTLLLFMHFCLPIHPSKR